MIPSLFIAHGAPLLALENNAYTQFVNHLGEMMRRPKAVVLFSAHWEAATQLVSQVEAYETIYDFGGFPDELYRIQYPARGDRQIAGEIAELLTRNGVPSAFDTRRGLDHGAWVVLRLLYPEAEIPVVAMSVNPRLTPEEQYQIGKALSTLRSKDVLIIGSGGTVHNLRAVSFSSAPGEVDDWALQFEDWLTTHLNNWDLTSLFKYDSLAPSAHLAVPVYGNEHFVPLFYAMGSADDVRTSKLLHRSYRYGNLSHSVWQFG